MAHEGFAKYEKALDNTGVDFNTLPDGTELEFEVQTFKEMTLKEVPNVIQKCVITRIVSLPDGHDAEDYAPSIVGKPFDQFHKFGPNNAVNGRILKSMFKDAGFETETWKPGTDTPPSQMVVMGLRYLALRKVHVFGKVVEGKPLPPKPGQEPKAPAKFFNWTGINRNDENGVPYPDGLGEKTTNAEVIEAWGEEIEGQESEAPAF